MIKPVSFLATCLTAAIAGFAPALAQQTKPDVERMYVLYCGDIALNDASSGHAVRPSRDVPTVAECVPGYEVNGTFSNVELHAGR